MAPAAPASSPPARVVLAAAALLMARSGSASGCSFCAGNKTFDLSSVPTEVFTLHSGTRGSLTDPWLTYYVTSPCGSVGSAPDDMCFGGSTSDPAAQHYTGTTPDGRYGAADPSPPHPPRPCSRCPARPPAARYGVAPICSGLGSLGKQPTVGYIGGVLEITLRGGTTEWCDGTASVTYRMTCSGHDDPPFPPEPVVEVHGNCSFSVDWRHPSICSAHSDSEPAGCSRPAPPAPPPAVCLGCLPPWKVTRCSILRTMCPT